MKTPQIGPSPSTITPPLPGVTTPKQGGTTSKASVKPGSKTPGPGFTLPTVNPYTGPTQAAHNQGRQSIVISLFK